MDDLIKALSSAASEQAAGAEEAITLNEYLERVAAAPTIAASAHQRIFNMITSFGQEEGAHKDEISYKFFADGFFGMDATIERVVRYFESAAQGHETRRRILLLWGPPGGAKSSLIARIKRGLEAYSLTDEGAAYALEGCPMHEEPLHLVPEALRAKVTEHTGVTPEGGLCPVCRYRLENDYDGDFMRFPIRRFTFSEAERRGISTFEAGDPKSMEMAHLTGGINFKAISEYGRDDHPMVLDWAGELPKGSRGLVEGVEYLKLAHEFRLGFLSVAQERQFKVPKFGYIDLDTVVIASTNESEYRAFMADQKNEALRDRLFTIPVPYNVRLSDEKKIYGKLLGQGAGSAIKEFHVAPHSLDAAAMVAVLSRLTEHPNLDPVAKMKLYDGKETGDWKLAQIPEIKRAADGEGLSGLGPRRIIDVLASAAVAAQKESHTAEPYLTPIIVLRALNLHIDRLDVSKEERDRLKAYVIDARGLIDEKLKKEVRRAFIPAFADQAQDLMENYLNNVEAYTQDIKLADPVTGEDVEPDETLMRAVEEKVSPAVAEAAKDTFRQGVLVRIGIALRRGGRPLTYSTDAQLGQALEEHLFEEMKDIVRVTTSKSNPDPEQSKRLNEVTRVLVEDRGYNEQSARELMDYVGQMLNR